MTLVTIDSLSTRLSPDLAGDVVLLIRRCGHVRSGTWFSDLLGQVPATARVVQITLDQGAEITGFRDFQLAPSLRGLDVRDPGSRLFPSDKSCPMLVSVAMPYADDELAATVGQLRLERLRIGGAFRTLRTGARTVHLLRCPNLRSLEAVDTLAPLKLVVQTSCSRLRLSECAVVPRLEELHVLAGGRPRVDDLNSTLPAARCLRHLVVTQLADRHLIDYSLAQGLRYLFVDESDSNLRRLAEKVPSVLCTNGYVSMYRGAERPGAREYFAGTETADGVHVGPYDVWAPASNR